MLFDQNQKCARASILSFSLLIFIFVFSGHGSVAISSDLSDPKYLFHSLKKVARELHSCRLVVAYRESERDASVKGSEARVTFADLWVDGDAIQCKELRKKSSFTSPDWWKGYAWDSSPFSTDKLEQQVPSPSYLRLFDDSHLPSFATYTPSVPGNDVHIGVFNENKTTGAISNVQIPLIGLNRKWTVRSAELDLVLNESLPADWTLIENESLNGISTVKYRIVRNQREFSFGDGEKLFVAKVWYLWFSEAFEYVPIRIAATTEYLLDGAWYPLVSEKGDKVFSTVCDVSDVLKTSGGILYPRNGKQSQKTPMKIQGSIKTFDPGSVAKDLREKKRWVSKNHSFSENFSEWKVLELSKLEGGMKLWIDAPMSSLVMNGNTVKIAGKSEVESNKILGSIPPAKKVEIEKHAAASGFAGFRSVLVVAVIALGALSIVWLWRVRKERN